MNSTVPAPIYPAASAASVAALAMAARVSSRSPGAGHSSTTF